MFVFVPRRVEAEQRKRLDKPVSSMKRFLANLYLQGMVKKYPPRFHPHIKHGPVWRYPPPQEDGTFPNARQR